MIAERAEHFGVPVIELPNDRVVWKPPSEPRTAYADAKATLAVVVAPPSKLKLEPIAPSADWRVDLAAGCPAHCSYCYLAGSLKGPPITRAYANLDEILGVLPQYMDEGTVTSRSAARSHEGTTFEASCYTDPLALEPMTGSLSRMIDWFGRSNAATQLRFTSKFADVEPLLALDHGGKTRMRASINPKRYARFEGGTAPIAQRLIALRRMSDAGYPVGLTIAPIIAADGWEDAYNELLAEAAALLRDTADLTIELITHRFTPGSKAVLDSWYPGSALDMTQNDRMTTLEALLGVAANAIKEPDAYGYEIKSFRGDKISLMTPTPDGGYQGTHPFREFMARYGRAAVKGDGSVRFTGTHRVGLVSGTTGFGMRVRGYDPASDTFDADAGIAVEMFSPETGDVVASWSLERLANSWNTKHASAMYVPAQARPVADNPASSEYRFGPHVLIGEGTDVFRLIRAIHDGVVWYDPADSIYADGKATVRPQWRTSVGKLELTMRRLYAASRIAVI